MIPWELHFSGIRDYPSTPIDISGEMEHVLFSGPNGSGKSTITFCLGAVLGSAKVDLEGLRSKNLPPNQVWRATIQLLFKNAGVKPIDAAAYVQFELNLEQKPGEPLKKEYWILEGDQPGEWAKSTKYTSGDTVYHLREYRHQLQHKYLVDPDAFYLIWYQQDVNQFAVMRPEERFRIFSEMTRIDQMQRNWEAVKEQLRDAGRALKQAEQDQYHHKFELDKWQKERDKLLDRNRRRTEGVSVTLTASGVLIRLYEEKLRFLQEQLAALDDRRNEVIDRWASLDEEKKRYEEELQQKQHQKETVGNQWEDSISKLDAVREQWEVACSEYYSLQDRLKSLSEQVGAIPFSFEEVKKQLALYRNERDRAQAEQQEVRERRQRTQDGLDDIQEEIAKLQNQIELHQERVTVAQKLLEEYGDSHSLHQERNALEKRQEHLKDTIRELSQKIEGLEAQEVALAQNQPLSRRQEKSIAQLKRTGMKVYTMRDLLEMSEHASLEKEARLEAIKYTLFVEAKAFVPPTDLYHVELPAIVPMYPIDAIPDLGIRIKEGLNDQLYAAAVKALWWIKQLTEGAVEEFSMDGTTIIDRLGRRGVQEELQWVLSTKGVQLRLRKIGDERQQTIASKNNTLEELAELETRLAHIRSVLQEVLNAEALLSRIAERDFDRKQLEQRMLERNRLRSIRDEADQLLLDLNACISENKVRSEQFESYHAIYKEYEQESENVERLHRLQRDISEWDKQMERYTREIEQFELQMERVDVNMESIKRRLREKRQQIEESQGDLDRIKRQRKDQEDETSTFELKWQETKQLYEEWSEKLDFVVKQLQEQDAVFPQLPDWSEAEALKNKEEALVQLNYACKEKVNELACENYEKMKEAFEQGAQEVQNARTLLEQLKENLDELEEKLTNTINYEVHRVHSMFVRYMDRFGFDGEVSWEMHESRQGEMKYYLYMKARKQGHRGSLEEVSVKGRGGKVGRGVSGGEESLSSLLFALALLKTIQAHPGYVVLDEFDSALDEGRKAKVFSLYEEELARKMIILSPKSHETDYLQHFSKAFVVFHDARVPQSQIVKIKKK
ncbi:chromosome segregation protein SMC [Brevibacillus parabrevis]|uniref:AAA family ATPase n=1 Tax=Brevibacillus parabrevis TaxID=54914 RepID=UPI0007AC1DBD|nr:AAA family ATPase [Brevibacillus parabrevis]KZE54107.1 chromosome segregation protein SMC [Brevibacillus parabrevis]